MAHFTLQDYAMGRELIAPDEWEFARINAEIFLPRVNHFLDELAFGIKYEISSGFRPSVINAKTMNAAKASYHMKGLAIDILDQNGAFRERFTPLTYAPHADLLRKYDLFMEHPAYTGGWFHLDMGARVDRPSRVFIPK